MAAVDGCYGLQSYSKMAREGHETLLGYRRQFTLFDINKDGVISPREFQAVSMKMGMKMTVQDICKMFSKPDMETNGVTFDEFVRTRQEKSGQHRRLTPYRDAFKRLDTQRRCFLLPEDLIDLIGRGLGYAPDRVEEFVWSFDSNKDGEITLMEFVELLDKFNELKNRLEEAFGACDRNKDGFVDIAEATAAFGAEATVIGYTPQQVVERLHEFDLDKDNKLNLQEFKSFFDIDF